MTLKTKLYDIFMNTTLINIDLIFNNFSTKNENEAWNLPTLKITFQTKI